MTYASLSQDLIKQHMNYDPETGWFTWIDRGHGRRPSKFAGGIGSNGYLVIRLDGRTFAAHRAAWVYVFGDIPAKMMIDHINGDRSDNRIKNLRLVTPYGNSKNQLPRRKNGMPRVQGRHVQAAKNKIKLAVAELELKEKEKIQETKVLKKVPEPKKTSRLSLMLEKKLPCP